MAEEKDIDNLYHKVNKLDSRMTEIEATRPFLKEMIERNIASSEKLSDTLYAVQNAMNLMNEKMDAQAKAIDTIKQDFIDANDKANKRINAISDKVESIEDKGKFDILNYLKQNWPWILIALALGINATVGLVKI